MLTIPFPTVLSANVENWWLDARTRSGGETIDGREQVISSGLGRWRATVTIPLFERPRILAYRSWLIRMDGRSNLTNIGPCDCANGNVIRPLIGGIPYSPDEAFHTDGAGFSQGGNPASVTTIAAIGSTTVQIDLGGTASPPVAGSFVGLGGYLYVVTSIIVLPGELATITVLPKLRTALAVDDPVEWCHARCPMRFLSDDTGQFELTLGRFGTATLELVEVF